jgi:hypothetical protein
MRKLRVQEIRYLDFTASIVIDGTSVSKIEINLIARAV